MSKVTICDRCGSSENVFCSMVINSTVTSTDFPEGFTINKQYDLCGKCAVELANRFVEHVDSDMAE